MIDPNNKKFNFLFELQNSVLIEAIEVLFEKYKIKTIIDHQKKYNYSLIKETNEKKLFIHILYMVL
jgi:hypothetical protein